MATTRDGDAGVVTRDSDLGAYSHFERSSKVKGFGILLGIAVVSAAAVLTLGAREVQAQQGGRPAAPSRSSVDALLADARAAMKAGNLQAAEKLLLEAESTGVRYPALNFGDSPVKVRRDLDAALKKAGQAPASKPTFGDVAQQLGGANNPFRGAATETAPSREAAEQSLVAARRALSVGDLAQAQQHLGLAQQAGVAWDDAADAPARVAESIEQLAQLNEMKQAPGSEGAWRANYARFLLRQAEALAASRDLDAATRTVNEAAQLDPRVNAGGITPETVLARIQQVRAGGAAAPATAPPQGIADAKAQTKQLLVASRQAWEAGNLAEAERLAAQAATLGVPETQFAPQEDRPSKLAMDLARARVESESMQLAGAELPVEQALSQAPATPSSVQPTQFEFGEGVQPLPYAGPEELASPLPTDNDSESPFALIEAGETALRSGDRAGALEAFRAAYDRRNELDLLSQQRLQGHLQMLSVGPSNGRSAAPAAEDGDLIGAAGAGQAVLSRQLSTEIGRRQSEAARIRERDPNKSLEILRESRQLIEDSQLDKAQKDQLLRRVDMSLSDTEKYIRDHKAELELDATNAAILDDIDRERVVKVQVQQKVAEMVDKYNKLNDEHRYAEAEIVAKQLYEIAPEELAAQQVWIQAKMLRRTKLLESIQAESEEGVANILIDAQGTASAALASANTPMSYGKDWPDRIAGRKGSDDLTHRRTDRELQIEQRLKTSILPKYTEAPLTQVIEDLSELAGVNIYLDPLGMSQEGVRSDTPITLNLPQEISLKSALQLILEPLHLTYTIKNEVLKITSEQISAGDVYTTVYDVADLVIPIPNFVPTNNMGLQGLINDAYAVQGYGASAGGLGGGPISVVAGTRPGQVAGPLANNSVMGQQWGGGGGGMPGSSGGFPSSPGGPPAGGAANADFDSLIDLIIGTVEYDSWMENGTGQGDIQPFPTNLSLVISQTQPVHEQIADLLEQLRRLQDLQVTIEVRFIRLTDSFFERIGVDFDFNIEDKSGLPTNPNIPGALLPGQSYEPAGRASATVGLNGTSTGITPDFTVDLDMPFRQGSFGLATPSFGQFAPEGVGSFGFAILSDIEAYFVINAAQGDRRANVLQAPKVTLFNGQQGLVVDSSFVPFVISVIPVVGEFAAAQQPVIVVLSEGTMMSVQAVVSNDRKYVRLTLVPFFSSIGDVREFTFEGSETTTTSSSNTTDADGTRDFENKDAAATTTRSGTTVQLPTFQVISVSTTVSVPDGGTVLLGGIKRLREGRNEFGVPLLSKLPYIDRLFRNVGIGRETDSLMMMVTPHIIIQEEEE
ncbi:MAG: hypothetical protein KDA44_00020, partial [Planctomycetales bacterium]|nr:hypothetical protein [Planctomycetales bacterium]